MMSHYLSRIRSGTVLFLLLASLLGLSACEGKKDSLFDFSKQDTIATDFELPTIDGKQLALSDYKDKLVVINFWASWCPPCRTEIPDFIKIQKKFKDQDFTFIGIAVEEKEDAKKYSDEISINYPVVYGTNDAFEVIKAYGNSSGALPYSVLIGRDQRILGIYPGLLSETRLTKAIEPHLKK